MAQKTLGCFFNFVHFVGSVVSPTAVFRINQLESFFTVCACCHRACLPDRAESERDAWVNIELFIRRTTETSISHGICPRCVEKEYGALNDPENGLEHPP